MARLIIAALAAAMLSAFSWMEGCGLFDPSFYLSQNPDVAASGMDPTDHYNRFGWKEARDPSARFSTSGYLAANPDVAAAGMNPLEHFVRFGLYEGRQLVAIPDLRPYMASSANCDGNPSTPLRQADPVTCVRVDYGSLGNPYWMATVTMRATVDGEEGAITTWSYIPLGPFVDPLQRGTCVPQTDLRCADGGEAYALRGERLVATHTQDNGQPGVVHKFPRPWVLATRQTIPCELGWTVYNLDERGCTAVIDWPHIGPIHTIVSEHGTAEQVERIFLAKGWGRLHWQAFSKKPVVHDLPERCPDVAGWNTAPRNPTHPTQAHLPLTDCRLAVRVVPLDWGLTGLQLWNPAR